MQVTFYPGRRAMLVSLLAVLVGLGLAESAAAGRSVKSPRRAGFSKARQAKAIHHPRRAGFVVPVGRDEPDVTFQQIIVVSTPEPEKPTGALTYVPPRWVDTEHGVQVLIPGAWVEAPSGR